MSYSVDVVENVLEKIKGNLDCIIYTEHCFDKLEFRLLDFEFVEKKLLEETPVDIKMLSHFPEYFSLTFESDEGTICIVVKIFNLKSLIIISAICGG